MSHFQLHLWKLYMLKAEEKRYRRNDQGKRTH